MVKSRIQTNYRIRQLKANPLSDEDISALEAFLNTLTDERHQN
ncbi:hypothetical protein [Mannheimia indoligenes]